MIINEAEQIFDLPVEYLERDAVFNSLQSMVESFRLMGVYDGEAVTMRLALDKKLSSEKATDEIIQKYAQIYLICQFSSFISLGDKARAELLKKRASAALQIGIKVKELIEDYLIYNYDFVYDQVRRKSLLKAYKENEELVARKPLKVWFQYYLASIKMSGLKRGAVERLNFINNGIEVKGLSDRERNNLIKALELLDWLEFPDEGRVSDNLDVIAVMDDDSERPMKMGELRALQKKGLWISPPSEAKIIALSELAMPRLDLSDIFNDIKQTHPTLSQLAVRLKSQFPEPTDWPAALKVLNDLRRQGYPQYMEAVYWDEEDGKFHWKM